MAETPKSIKVKVDFDHPAIKKALKEAENIGFNEGLDQGRRDILDWLQRVYLEDSGRPDRGSPLADALLALAQDAAAHFRKVGKKGHRR